MTADALVDSNVIVASIAGDHLHHRPSYAVLGAPSKRNFAVVAHSFAEAYVTLTRQGPKGFSLTSHEAWMALEAFRAKVALVGLTSPQCLDTIRKYAADGGIGARIYDALIGQAAVLHAIPTILTWNTKHMLGLFPALDVITPTAFLSRS